MILLLEVVVDDGEVVKEDGHQVGAVEVIVAEMRDILLDKRHAVEIAQEVGALDFGWINTLVTEFAEKASVAAIDGKGDTTEIADKVVGGTSVDVVDSHAGRNLRDAPSHIDGMGSKEIFMVAESILKLQITLFALRIVFTIRSGLARSIRQYFSTIGMDTYADHATLAVVGIERDTGFRAGADVAHLDVVKEEGRADQIRHADEFKAAFSQAFLIRNFIHKHRQSEGC